MWRLMAGRRTLALTVALGALFAAGIATAAAVNKITLRGGQCVTVKKTRVCAAKAPTTTVAITTETTTVMLTLTLPPPPPSVAFSDGTYRVNIDIQPGTYRASDPANCYWARLRGFSGGLGDIIANANYVGIVTIASSDTGFLSKRCGDWSRLG